MCVCTCLSGLRGVCVCERDKERKVFGLDPKRLSLYMREKKVRVGGWVTS